MDRQPMSCDFCGSLEPLIPYDEPGFSWYACPECTQLIENGEWDGLADRCVAGHKVTANPSADTRLLRTQAQALVRRFRECLLVAALNQPDPRAQYGMSAK